jgi:hypothetical protein
MTQSAEASRPDTPDTPDSDGRTGIRTNEDWAATGIGLVLVLLVLAGVIVKGMVP